MAQRTAFVTGGVGTIGTEICRQLCQAGHRVAASYHPLEKNIVDQWSSERKAEGFEIEVACCNLGDFDATADAFEQAETAIGPIDVLVNVAGITRDASLRKMTVEDRKSVV